jgi:hypothetical protein
LKVDLQFFHDGFLIDEDQILENFIISQRWSVSMILNRLFVLVDTPTELDGVRNLPVATLMGAG